MMVSQKSPRNKMPWENTPVMDAYGRLRTSEPFSIFNNKNVTGKQSTKWNEDINGVGASINHRSDASLVELNVGTVSGEFAIRQTKQYFPYISGKSQYFLGSTIFGSGQANTVRRMGYFDDSDGLFFELDGSDIYVVKRSSVNGSVVDNRVPRDEWNIENMEFDPTKVQIMVIDFQWLASGRVRFGCNLDGNNMYIHELLHANEAPDPYMSTGSLPIRYEIRNKNTTAGPAGLKEICCTSISEGGYNLTGLEFEASNGTSLINVGTTKTPILAIRLKDTFGGKSNRSTIQYVETNLFSEDQSAYFEIAHLDNPTVISGVWTSVGDDSAVEFSTNITSISGAAEHNFGSLFVAAGAGAKGPGINSFDPNLNGQHTKAHQNKNSDNSQAFVVYATSRASTTDVSASITWEEFN